MKIQEVEILLKKYLEGETSLEEEGILKSFFRRDDIPRHLQHYRTLFGYFSAEEKISAGADIEENFKHRISYQQRKNLFANRRSLWILSSVAAALLLLFTILLNTGEYSLFNDKTPVQAYSDEEIEQAYLITKGALAFASEKYNQGTAPLENFAKIDAAGSLTSGLEKFDRGMNEMNKGFNQINEGADHLSKISKFNLLINP
jgi:uncharacterized membrane protein